MDITTMAASITAALVPAMPYLVKGGEKLAEMAAEQLGGAAFDQARALWERLRGPMEASPAANEAARDLAEEPDDDDTQAALRRQIKKMLGADAELMQQIAVLLEAGGQKVEYHAELHGDGAIAQGEGAVAAGKGGIAVGGDVHGTIVTGRKDA